MKTVSLFAVCSVLAISSAFAQGDGLTIEFDKDTPASEKQAFVESYKHQQDIRHNSRDQGTRTVQKSNGLSPHQAKYNDPPQESNTFGGMIVKGIRLKQEARAAEIQDMKDRTNNERIMAENGDSQGLANSRQERSNRETSEQLRQIQNTQRKIQSQNAQIQNQNTQREIQNW